MAIWVPDLSGRRGPAYLAIVEALADDIAAGALAPGARLPAHRELADALGLSPNTTSRAYAEAVARALVRGEVGRGTFVRAPGALVEAAVAGDLRRDATGPIDLSRNLPNRGAAGEHLARTLEALGRDGGRTGGLQGLLDYQDAADSERAVGVALAWLARVGLAAAADEVVVTVGAQHALLAALLALTRPGDLILTEALTYAPVKAMAARLGLTVRGLPLDADGLCPDAVDAVCADHAPRLLYLTPTLQTPTAGIMPEARRRALVAVAARHDLLLIEDDVFGPLVPDAPPPLARLAPDRVVYLSSTSKALAPGLRVGVARAPAPLANALHGAVTLSCWMAPPLMAEIAGRWIADGTATRLTEAQRAVARRRQALAVRAFDGLEARAHPCGLHLWLPLPTGWTADALRAEAATRGVRVTEAAAFAVDPAAAPEAVRLCLSHEPDEDRLTRALATIRRILDAPPEAGALIL
ncbi:PLP-dependent aminotransferase family protein [Rhodospira trueperi]|uniref:DNA-binding transcriptional regulator, MocR family, contains an aminotransferase domain n=1 Tax=Rhodospira trueperi TaxID=69960 RepID=A0A1G7FQ69_9PROT|nr:PLP-dependent aminotransferase family protein [Rhodospira trueperi]SDE78056.1 DNA-binding transcriptional regulator, MocR family, contains an aminotransferase domain [Rhodospira trueperi]